MKRSKLTADPAKVAAFNQRGRGSLKRAATAPSDFRDDAGRPITVPPFAAPSRSRTSPVKVPTNARKVALARSRGRCVVCGDRAHQCHHVFPKSKWPELIKDPDNLVGVCARCHMAHEFIGVKATRIPLAALPACAIALAAAESRRQTYLERTYR